MHREVVAHQQATDFMAMTATNGEAKAPTSTKPTSPLSITGLLEAETIDIVSLLNSLPADSNVEQTAEAVLKWWHRAASSDESTDVASKSSSTRPMSLALVLPLIHRHQTLFSVLNQRTASDVPVLSHLLLDTCCTALISQDRTQAANLAEVPEFPDWRPLIVSGVEIAQVGCHMSPFTETASPGIPMRPFEIGGSLLNLSVRRQELLWNEKLESLAEYAAGAGHEINNPLGTIAGRVQILLSSETDPERRQSLLTIGGQAMRARDMIGDTMTFGRPPQPQPTQGLLLDRINAVGSRFSDDLKLQRLTIDIQVDPTVQVFADSTQHAVVVSELLRNAIEASPAGGTISLRGQERTVEMALGEQRRVTEWSIHNAGPPLTELEAQHLFDPFFSGRQAGRGLGFGLSKCWRIVTLHGGCIHAKSDASGVTFTLHFPLPAN